MSNGKPCGGEIAKGVFKWLAITTFLAMICTGTILYMIDLSKQASELREDKRIAELSALILKKHQKALDGLAEVTLKTYQTEAARMIAEIKGLREEIVSLKQDLRDCVGKKGKP